MVRRRAIGSAARAAIAVLLFAPGLSGAQGSRGHDAVGCWESSRVLGPSYLGMDPRRDPRDSSYRVFRLQDSGQVSLPLMATASLWNANSAWRISSDTLHVRIFTGLQG